MPVSVTSRVRPVQLVEHFANFVRTADERGDRRRQVVRDEVAHVRGRLGATLGATANASRSA